MATLERDGLGLHYEIDGDARDSTPLLMTHGFSASGRMWSANVAALASGRQVITWDMRGHAESGAPDDPAQYGVEQSVGDMVSLLDAADARRAVLAGMSLGGYLSLAFCARHPERVAGLILVDTGPGFRRDEPREQWNANCERTATRLESGGAAALPPSPERGAHQGAHGLAHTARRVMAQHDGHVIASLAAIAVPTLVVVGADDTNFLAAADYMASHIAGARKVVLADAGHAANIDAADEFNAAVVEFLADVP
jgi:pimeloyl-ACP methyl ester carboxylesterase